MKLTLTRLILATAILAGGPTVALADGAKIFVVGGKPDDPFWSVVLRWSMRALRVSA